MIQLVVSIVLYFVIFFGLSFILNMLLRKTWLMSFIYPIIVVIIIDGISTFDYLFKPSESFSTAYDKIINLTVVDITVLLSGLVGTIVSGIVIRMLRKSGYQMF
ncbi:YuiB family protein [Ornithinibacillus sp. 4-3]|uniref:YuiB family protein n=1 Tax=Ornithinibacillus sp. 4-3 TaxID=3231488 RepID=A0AB39HI26_9BACI